MRHREREAIRKRCFDTHISEKSKKVKFENKGID